VIAVYRAWGDPPFTEEDRDLVHRYHQAIRRSLRTPDEVLFRLAAEQLSPRARTVLDHLLAGSTEKEAAKDLYLSVHTVHQYVKDIHRTFEVSSRGELVSRWHRRARDFREAFKVSGSEPLQKAAALSPRRRETLELMLRGLSEKEIANAMKLSPHTVHERIKDLYQVFGVSRRAELLALFMPLL
jgi:DNA-binding CsgD family transcriptional regulator